MVTAVCFIENL